MNDDSNKKCDRCEELAEYYYVLKFREDQEDASTRNHYKACKLHKFNNSAVNTGFAKLVELEEFQLSFINQIMKN